jgi:hypothetical protein
MPVLIYQARAGPEEELPDRWCDVLLIKPYGLVHLTALDPFGKEFGASVRLKTLDF